jgi:choline dehydrogenase-like flavoprotein
MIETADVIIVGAGVQGASLAFHLARRGTRVLVLERESVAAGATGRSSGFVRMHYDLESDARLAWASFPYFDYRGTLLVAKRPTETSFLRDTNARSGQAVGGDGGESNSPSKPRSPEEPSTILNR